MDMSLRGSFRLFRAWGIDVYLHWSWFLIAFFIIGMRRVDDYQSTAWRIAEYLALFSLVLLHEFGHSLACRSVGGEANRIVLWPLGGIAYVAPPQRPGPILWSIVAGPLVNFVLIVPLFGLALLADSWGWMETHPDLSQFFWVLARVNLGLLLFNMLPIYPLDGGQILQAMLWFAVGRWRSLFYVSIIGVFLGGCVLLGCLMLLVFFSQVEGIAVFALLLGAIALFMVMRSLTAFHTAHHFLVLESLPRHRAVRCPHCQTPPPQGLYWVCEHCDTRFDLFDRQGRCPGCGAWYLQPSCPHCHQHEHIDRWLIGPLGDPV